MEFLMTVDNTEEFLAHHGIKGMKWGVWNDETKRRYGLLPSLAAMGGGGGGEEDDQEKKIVEKIAEMIGESVDYIEANKNVFKNILETYYKDPALLQQAIDNAKEVSKRPDFWQKGDPMDSEEAMKGTNPFAGAGQMELKGKMMLYSIISKIDPTKQLTESDLALYDSLNNCATCSLIFDLRKRGYDVDANMTRNMMYVRKEIGALYPGAEEKVVGKSTSQLTSELEKMPVGARGECNGTTVNGSGHSITWERTPEGVVYRDCQVNKTYKGNDVDKVFANDDKQYQRLAYTRLDDKVPDISKFYQQGLASKKGKESEEALKDDQTRNAAGQMARSIRLGKTDSTTQGRVFVEAEYDDPYSYIPSKVTPTNITKGVQEIVKYTGGKEPRRGFKTPREYYNIKRASDFKHSEGRTEVDILMTVDNMDDFLAHHGVKGMKWGVHNMETKLKYGEISHMPGAGGGGGESDDEEWKKLKEELDKQLREGKISKEYYEEKLANARKNGHNYPDDRNDNAEKAKELHERMATANRLLREGKVTKQEYDDMVQSARERYTGKGGYTSEDGSVHWNERELFEQANRRREDRKSDAREMAREWGHGGDIRDIQTAVKQTAEVEKRAKGLERYRQSAAKAEGGYSNGETKWSGQSITNLAGRSKVGRAQDARETASEWKTDGLRGVATTIGKTVAVEKRAAEIAKTKMSSVPSRQVSVGSTAVSQAFNKSRIEKNTLSGTHAAETEHKVRKTISDMLYKRTPQQDTRKDWQKSVSELKEEKQQRQNTSRKGGVRL